CRSSTPSCACCCRKDAFRRYSPPASLLPQRRERSILNGLSAAQKSPRLAPRASFRSRNRSYLLTAILACRSVGRTIGKGGLVTTSLTQRASPPLKYDVAFALRNASML